MIIIKIAIAGLIVFWAYWLIDCLMSGKKQSVKKAKPVAKLIEKPVEPVNKQWLTYQKLTDRIEIKGTNVTDPNVYTQNWEQKETIQERMDRLESLRLKQAKSKLLKG